MWIYISDAVLTFAGYMYAIPRYGWLGAAGFTIFSELYAGVLLALVIARSAPVTLSFVKFGKIILAGLLMVGALLLLGNFSLLVSIPIGALVYFMMLYFLGAFSLDTIRALFKPTAPLK